MNRHSHCNSVRARVRSRECVCLPEKCRLSYQPNAHNIESLFECISLGSRPRQLRTALKRRRALSSQLRGGPRSTGRLSYVMLHAACRSDSRGAAPVCVFSTITRARVREARRSGPLKCPTTVRSSPPPHAAAPSGVQVWAAESGVIIPVLGRWERRLVAGAELSMHRPCDACAMCWW